MASSRAAETGSKNPLIRDPFAQVFLDAAGDGMWNCTPCRCRPVIEAEPQVPLQMRAISAK
jgi:O-methyltransferase involved in polyketide biosynthesis